MKNIWLLIFLLPASVFAQSIYDRGKSDQNKFIEKSSVEWAITADDTLQTPAPDLRELLINKALAGQIKLLPPPFGIPQPELNAEKAEVILADANAKGLVNVRKILFVKNGKLFAYIYSVSPLVSVITNSGMYLGRGELFSTAENLKNKTKFKKKDLQFITSDKKEFYTDSVAKTDRLKETFGRNLIETLWSHMLSGKIAVYTTDNKRLNLSVDSTDNADIPVYDNTAAVSGKVIYEKILPARYNKISLLQNWFYHRKKNILICTISEAYLYPTPPYGEELKKDDPHILKIVF